MMKKETRQRKTTAKKMGLKSTIVADNKIVVTSFVNARNSSVESGKEMQKKANIEKITNFSGEEIDNSVAEQRMFSTEVTPEKVKIQKGQKGAECSEFDNPATLAIGKDYVGIRTTLEKEYFDKEYPEDNLHVQIAYNVADVKKILSAYVNNIIYMFYNLARNNEKDLYERNIAKIEVADGQDTNRQRDNDLIGTLKYQFSYKNQDQEKFKRKKEQVDNLLNNTRAYYTYFDGVFVSPKKDKNNKISDEERENALAKNFDVLRLLSAGRQLSFHSEKNQNDAYLFDLSKMESEFKDIKQLSAILDELCNRNFESVNRDFQKNSGNNLFVLRNVYPNEKAENLVRDYYKFVVEKESRNIGIRLITLREYILARNSQLRNDKYNTYRNKIYTVLNFVLYREVLSNPIGLQNFREQLRAAEKDEQQELYKKFAEKMYPMLENKLNAVLKKFDDQEKKKFKDVLPISDDVMRKIALNAQGVDYFSKYILFLTKFLDGKETNELLCALINKFDNIAELFDIARQIGIDVNFTKEYDMLNRTDRIAKNIRLIKNIAHMRPVIQDNKRQGKGKDEGSGVSATLLVDAYNMLNTDVQVVYGSDEYDALHKELFEIKKKGKKDHKFRNFLINNVIKSKWFFYIAKYANPADCAKMMSNKSILEFALRDLPETQVKRYYRTITGIEHVKDVDKLKGVIIEKLHDFSVQNAMKEIKLMGTAAYTDQSVSSKKEQLKAIVNLYLTVAYLITKSLTKVNVRFSIAFGCLERDYFLTIGKVKKNPPLSDKIRMIIEKDEERRKEIYGLIQQAKAKGFGKDASPVLALAKKKEKECWFKNYHDYKYVKENLQEGLCSIGRTKSKSERVETDKSN